MYKCGWQGCEKAYGTLNHLNAHVTMQSHGAKRTPEGTFFGTVFKRLYYKASPRFARVMRVVGLEKSWYHSATPESFALLS
jgi:hypothetical protein